MIPLSKTTARDRFEHHRVYRFVEHEPASRKSRNHYFASVAEAWQNLPEHLAERFPSAEHLRKWALIRSGFHDQRSIVAGSKAEALRIASFVRPLDEYAVVVAREATVLVYTAQSQSTRAMGRAKFQQSKEAVLDILAEMVGVGAGDLEREAGKAA